VCIKAADVADDDDGGDAVNKYNKFFQSLQKTTNSSPCGISLTY